MDKVQKLIIGMIAAISFFVELTGQFSLSEFLHKLIDKPIPKITNASN
jgi:predicted KAP-like P-loop ATPase